MKQFIVLLAVIPVMLLFFMQFSLEQRNNMKISLMTDIVYAAKEEAKQKGGFDEDALRTELSEKLGVSPEEIIIEVPKEGSVKRIGTDGSRGIIYYSVTVPIGEVSAGSKYFGIKDGAKYGYRIESSCPSEYIGK